MIGNDPTVAGRTGESDRDGKTVPTVGGGRGDSPSVKDYWRTECRENCEPRRNRLIAKDSEKDNPLDAVMYPFQWTDCVRRATEFTADSYGKSFSSNLWLDRRCSGSADPRRRCRLVDSRSERPVSGDSQSLRRVALVRDTGGRSRASNSRSLKRNTARLHLAQSTPVTGSPR